MREAAGGTGGNGASGATGEVGSSLWAAPPKPALGASKSECEPAAATGLALEVARAAGLGLSSVGGVLVAEGRMLLVSKATPIW